MAVENAFSRWPFRKDVSTHVARNGAAQTLSGCDDRFLAARGEETQHRLDLWTHTAVREVAGGRVPFQIGDMDLAQRPLRGLLLIEVNVIRIGRDNEQIDSQAGSE